MAHICLILLFLFSGVDKKYYDFYSIKNDILENSIIGYKTYPVTDNPYYWEFVANLSESSFVDIYCHVNTEIKETQEWSKISNKNKYLKLWKYLLKKNIWDLKSVTLENIPVELLDKDKIRFDELIPYKDWDLIGIGGRQVLTYEFFFKIKNMEKKIIVWDITNLKDKRYLLVLKRIDKYFGFRSGMESEIDKFYFSKIDKKLDGTKKIIKITDE